ncbi:kinetochore protein Spc7 [Schizosaccharomyces japonicus yFS275]|uniref:Kinetochore protein Spc7 n=1 Tax=Schizosaccharomyces japonicus (strain yFS275 / FY16936) TaxID=402676 RepID=B6K6D0_SCHJY|nr:kinetochore protein Spc7 [Schizosaccharomyces japonicus yFS275]EEB09084.1 kinetochore protein Spc7 [Schizosaccharomyces japonicus yFS275]
MSRSPTKEVDLAAFNSAGHKKRWKRPHSLGEGYPRSSKRNSIPGKGILKSYTSFSQELNYTEQNDAGILSTANNHTVIGIPSSVLAASQEEQRRSSRKSLNRRVSFASHARVRLYEKANDGEDELSLNKNAITADVSESKSEPDSAVPSVNNFNSKSVTQNSGQNNKNPAALEQPLDAEESGESDMDISQGSLSPIPIVNQNSLSESILSASEQNISIVNMDLTLNFSENAASNPPASQEDNEEESAMNLTLPANSLSIPFNNLDSNQKLAKSDIDTHSDEEDMQTTRAFNAASTFSSIHHDTPSDDSVEEMDTTVAFNNFPATPSKVGRLALKSPPFNISANSRVNEGLWKSGKEFNVSSPPLNEEPMDITQPFPPKNMFSDDEMDLTRPMNITTLSGSPLQKDIASESVPSDNLTFASSALSGSVIMPSDTNEVTMDLTSNTLTLQNTPLIDVQLERTALQQLQESSPEQRNLPASVDVLHEDKDMDITKPFQQVDTQATLDDHMMLDERIESNSSFINESFNQLSPIPFQFSKKESQSAKSIDNKESDTRVNSHSAHCASNDSQAHGNANLRHKRHSLSLDELSISRNKRLSNVRNARKSLSSLQDSAIVSLFPGKKSPGEHVVSQGTKENSSSVVYADVAYSDPSTKLHASVLDSPSFGKNKTATLNLEEVANALTPLLQQDNDSSSQNNSSLPVGIQTPTKEQPLKLNDEHLDDVDTHSDDIQHSIIDFQSAPTEVSFNNAQKNESVSTNQSLVLRQNQQSSPEPSKQGSGLDKPELAPLSLEEFLQMTGISFLDDLVHLKPPASPTLKEEPPAPLSLADRLKQFLVQFPCSELYKFGCQELNNYIVEGQNVVNKLSNETNAQNPLLMFEYRQSNASVKQTMESQFRLLKSYSRLRAKSVWYEWRMSLLQGIERELRSNMTLLQKSEASLLHAKSIVHPYVFEVSERHSKLLNSVSQLKRQKELASQYDNEAAVAAENKLAELVRKIELKRTTLLEQEKSLKKLKAAAEAITEKSSQLRVTISNTEKFCETHSSLSRDELSEYKRQLELWKSRLGWDITGITTNGFTLRLLSDSPFSQLSVLVGFGLSSISLECKPCLRLESELTEPLLDYFLVFYRNCSLPRQLAKLRTHLRSLKQFWTNVQPFILDVHRLVFLWPNINCQMLDRALQLTVPLLLLPENSAKVELTLLFPTKVDNNFSLSLLYNQAQTSVRLCYGSTIDTEQISQSVYEQLQDPSNPYRISSACQKIWELHKQA